MKKSKSFLSLFLLSLIILSCFSVLHITPVVAEIVDTNDEANPISTNVQENMFIWNNRIWVFYCNGSYIVCRSRSNLTSWTDEVTIRANTDGKYFSVWLEEDGTNGYVHYAATNYEWELYDDPPRMFYRKGQLSGYGTISWLAGEQTIDWWQGVALSLNFRVLEPYITTDSSGYPIIIACIEYSSGNYWETFIRRSSTKDGTFTEDWERSWLYQEVPSWSNVFYINQIIPMTNRKFMVITVRGNAQHRAYYWDGASFIQTNAEEYGWGAHVALSHIYRWDAVCESGTDIIHVVYNKYNIAGNWFQHRSWNGSYWNYVDPPDSDGTGKYEWHDDTVPSLTLNSSDNTMRATWLEYNGTSFLNNTVWYRDWNGSAWNTPSVWFTETDDIIEHEDFSSIYSSDTYYAISYLTNATSVNVEAYWTPPLIPPPAAEYYDVEIYIRINGYEPYTNVTFQIDTVEYANGQTASLFSDISGDYHNLTGTSIAHLSFINWTVTGDLTITNSTDPASTLFVSGTGTLTEHLNATVAITHSSTTITNMNADTWLFAEYKYYSFQSQYIMTNSYIDTLKWSFLDHATHNITFYYNNATTEGILYGSSYIALGDNATCAYSWLNLTDQTVTVTISVWVKHYIIDTMYVDLYVYGNCSGYGMTNSTANGGYWTTAQSDYFNLYAQGGAEELTIGVVTGGMVEDSSVYAGRSEGGDIFNLYAYNDTFALSEQYWRNLVHVKVLFEFQWDYGYAGGLPWDLPSADFPIDLHYQLGWTYYARGNWSINRFSRIDLKLLGFGYGANHQFSKWSIKIVHGGVQVYSDTLFGWFDDDAKTYKVWMDLWFNEANASSVAGARVTSYWYGVHNTAEWWRRVFTGNDWGVQNENQTSHLAFGMLRDEDVYADRIFSSEIELVKLWCRMYQSNTAYNYSAQIWKIEIFDKVYDPHSMGIPTPAFEAPHMPSMPMGGFLGVIYGALMWIANQLGPGALEFWRVFVAFLDTVAFWLGFPNGFTNLITWISDFLGFLGTAVTTLVTILTSLFEIVTGPLVTFLSILGGMITNVIASITGMLAQLTLAYNDSVLPLTPLISPVLTLIAIMLPFLELARMEQMGFGILFQDIDMIFNLLAFFVGIFTKVINTFLSLIGRVIESIPIIE